MSEMVEKVARVLATAAGYIDHDKVMFNPFTEQEVPLWTGFVPQARGVIAAMREPSLAMRLCGWEHYDRDGSGPADIYEAMVDEALK